LGGRSGSRCPWVGHTPQVVTRGSSRQSSTSGGPRRVHRVLPSSCQKPVPVQAGVSRVIPRGRTSLYSAVPASCTRPTSTGSAGPGPCSRAAYPAIERESARSTRRTRAPVSARPALITLATRPVGRPGTGRPLDDRRLRHRGLAVLAHVNARTCGPPARGPHPSCRRPGRGTVSWSHWAAPLERGVRALGTNPPMGHGLHRMSLAAPSLSPARPGSPGGPGSRIREHVLVRLGGAGRTLKYSFTCRPAVGVGGADRCGSGRPR